MVEEVGIDLHHKDVVVVVAAAGAWDRCYFWEQFLKRVASQRQNLQEKSHSWEQVLILRLSANWPTKTLGGLSGWGTLWVALRNPPPKKSLIDSHGVWEVFVSRSNGVGGGCWSPWNLSNLSLVMANSVICHECYRQFIQCMMSRQNLHECMYMYVYNWKKFSSKWES